MNKGYSKIRESWDVFVSYLINYWGDKCENYLGISK